MVIRRRWWLWLAVIVLIGGACWAANLALANWWAAGGPPTAQADLYELRGNLSCAVSLVFFLLAVLLSVINVRWRRHGPREDGR